MNEVLRVPNGELARLVALQRKQEPKRETGEEAPRGRGACEAVQLIEREPEPPGGAGSGLKDFLQDASLSGTATTIGSCRTSGTQLHLPASRKSR